MIPNAPPAFPITLESLKVFLTFRKNYEHVAYSTLQGNVAAIRHHIGVSGAPDPTRTFEFKNFFKGIRREMKPDTPPNRKLPITSEHLDAILDHLDETSDESVEVCLLMSLGFGL